MVKRIIAKPDATCFEPPIRAWSDQIIPIIKQFLLSLTVHISCAAFDINICINELGCKFVISKTTTAYTTLAITYACAYI